MFCLLTRSIIGAALFPVLLAIGHADTAGILQNGPGVEYPGVVPSIAYTTRFSIPSGSLILIPLGTNTNSVPSMTDNHSGSPTLILSSTGNSSHAYLFCEIAPATGVYTFTATNVSGSFFGAELSVVVYKGGTCTTDGTAIGTSAGANPLTTSTSVTTTHASDILFCFSYAQASTANNYLGAGNSFLIEDWDSVYENFIVADRQVTTTTTTACSTTSQAGPTFATSNQIGSILLVALQISGGSTGPFGPQLLVVGDSLTAGASVSLVQRYPDQAIASIGTAIYYRNFGTGGESIQCAGGSCSMQPTMNGEFSTRIAPYVNLTSYPNTIIAMQGGLNDVGTDAPSEATLQTRQTTWLNLALATGAPYIIISTVTSNAFMDALTAGYRNAYNSWLRTQAGIICGNTSCVAGSGNPRIIIADAASDPNIGCDSCYMGTYPTTYFINDPHLTGSGGVTGGGGYGSWALSFKNALQAASATVAVTVPGSIIGLNWLLTATTTLASTAHVEFYVDNRFECSANYASGGLWQCPYQQEPFSDYKSEQVYAIAKDSAGSVIGTSSTVTFNLRNHGLNVAPTFNQAGPVVSGSLTWTIQSNATTSQLDSAGTSIFYLDGLQAPQRTSRTPTSNINTGTSTITVPLVQFWTGQAIQLSCAKAGDNGTSCSPYPSPLSATTYYAIVADGNHMRLATSKANALANTFISITTQGDAAGMLQFSATPEWYASLGNNPLSQSIDTTYFPNGYHRLESTMTFGTGALPTGTMNFVAAAVNVGSNLVSITNHPFVNGQAYSISNSGGGLPGGVSASGTLDVIDPNTFRFHGQTITTAGTGTQTISFTNSLASWYNPSGIAAVWGADVTRFDFENGAVIMELRPAMSMIPLVAAETANVGAYYFCTDGTSNCTGAPSGLIYGTSDSACATVNSSGVITGVGSSGNCYITVIDNTNSRVAQLEVRAVPDHTTFKHLSRGHGILTTYTPGQSLVVNSLFQTGPLNLVQIPFPTDEPSAFWKYSGINTVEGVNSNTDFALGSYAGFSTWLTRWQAATGASDIANGLIGISLQSVQLSLAHGNMAGLGINTFLCGGTNGVWQSTSWRTQAYGQIANDLAPYQVGVDECDEVNSHLGPIAKAHYELGSGNDGLTSPGCSSSTCGFINVVVTGCAATPCTGTGTVSDKTYQDFGVGAVVFLWGASSTNGTALNGAYWPSSVTHDLSNVNGAFLTGYTIRTVDVLNGTYNVSTDSAMNIGPVYGGYFGSIFYNAPGAIPYGWGSGGPTSITVSSNTATITWASHPFVEGQILAISGMSNANWQDPTINPGLYPVHVINSGSISIRVVSVPAATYNSGTDAGGQFGPLYLPTQFPQSYPLNLAKTWITGAAAPFAWPPLGGGTIPQVKSWVTDTDMGQYNSIFIAGPSAADRFGPMPYSFTTAYQNLFGYSGLVNRYNLYQNAPFTFESSMNGDTCTRQSPGYTCSINNGADLIDYGQNNPATAFVTVLYPFAWGAAGVRRYGGLPWSNKLSDYQAGSTQNANFQSGSDYIDVYPSIYQGAAIPTILTSHLEKYFLAPLSATPYYGPVAYSGTRKIPSSGGTMHIVGSWSEETQSVTVNLSTFALGGPIRKYMASIRGVVVTSITIGTTSDTCTMPFGSACVYVFQSTGAPDELSYKSVNSVLPSGAAKSLVEIHYYPKDDPLAIYDCTSACSIPVDTNGSTPVWMRHIYTATDGHVVAKDPLVQRIN